MTKSRKTTAAQPAAVPETASEPGFQTSETDTPRPTAVAIALCHAAYKQALEAYARVHGPHTLTSYSAEKVARVAYCKAMPVLSSRENIRAFIGCVADAVLIEAIREDTSARLLYAAQVALTGLPRESHHSMSITTTANPSTDH